MTPVWRPLPLRQGLSSRLAGVIPPHPWALAVCTLALLLGVALADDYGVWFDAYIMRAIGEATLRHLAGENGPNLLWPPWNRLYGPIVETPLALVERILGRDDSRRVFLSRHLLTHLFFVAAGLAGYLLARRLFDSRWLALFALLLFLLHPRIYAHSFFNSKDVPFLAIFMICLWLAQRAFGSARAGGDGAAVYGALALCGVAAGLLTNLRILGLVFVAIVLFMRLCDAIGADSWRERKRIVGSGLLFVLAAGATYYATVPYLWADPLVRFREILGVLSAHPTAPVQLFQGERVLTSELPWSYLPVWFGITTPPLALLLGSVGFAALVWRVAAGRRVLLSNTALRFEVLVAACFVLPVLAVVMLRPTQYDDWRHFYFLWAPFVLLATSGLRTLVRATHRLGWTKGSLATAGLAALGLVATVVEMTRLHPYQHLYFNVLANRPGAAKPLHQRFDVADRFSVEHGYVHILEELADREHPDAVFNTWLYHSERNERELGRLGIAMPHANLELFRQRDQRRFQYDPNADVDFYVKDRGQLEIPEIFPPVLYRREVYGREIVRVATPDLTRVDAATAHAYRAIYREVASGTPIFRGDIDIYRDEGAISWVKTPCAPGEVNGTMDMIVVPLGAASDRYTHRARGVRIGDACLWQTTLPDHAIAKVLFPYIGAIASDAHIEERRRRYARFKATPPLAHSTFDVHLEDGTLFYVKTPCVQADTDAPFFVHVQPARLGDLPRSRHRHGFDTLDFRFGGFDLHWHYVTGDLFDGVCMAALELPDYPIASIATGQYTRGGASLWRVHVDGG